MENLSQFISSDFDEPVLYAPARIEMATPCNSLKIVTAFTDCERISTHMINLSDGIRANRFTKGLSVDIVLGMTKSSLSKKKHEDICRLIEHLNQTRYMPKVSCRYICSGQEVHSKVYVWGCQDNRSILIPQAAYCGSLNYTMNAFYKRRETVTSCDPKSAYTYYKGLLNDTIDCFESSAMERLNITNHVQQEEDPDNAELDYAVYDAMQPIAVAKISLLTADGQQTGYGSGVNWGIRRNGTRRNPNQAYIPYNVQDRCAGFFPDQKAPEEKNFPLFRVITKDFGSFHMRIAQQGQKAIHTAESNAILGEWIRRKMGVPSGGFITKTMLENYGKTYVIFRKYEDNVYLLDF